MRFKLKCKACGATCWAHGEIEEDTNATNLDENFTEWSHGGCGKDCAHDDVEIIDQETDNGP